MQLIKRITPFTKGKIPLAVGFGVSKPEHAKRIMGAGADGVIVGSAFVSIIQRHQRDVKRMLDELEGAACKLKKATRRL